MRPKQDGARPWRRPTELGQRARQGDVAAPLAVTSQQILKTKKTIRIERDFIPAVDVFFYDSVQLAPAALASIASSVVEKPDQLYHDSQDVAEQTRLYFFLPSRRPQRLFIL